MGGGVQKRELVKLARRLRAGYYKDTEGKSPKWEEATREDQRIWKRMAKRAAKVLKLADTD
jgi:hypothetical protein